MTALPPVEQPAKAWSSVETLEAAPIDRTVARDQRRRLAVADEGIVGDGRVITGFRTAQDWNRRLMNRPTMRPDSRSLRSQELGAGSLLIDAGRRSAAAYRGAAAWPSIANLAAGEGWQAAVVYAFRGPAGGRPAAPPGLARPRRARESSRRRRHLRIPGWSPAPPPPSASIMAATAGPRCA